MISADCLSSFSKSWKQLTGLQSELDEDYRWRTRINAIVPKAEKIILRDNHFFQRLENRKRDTIWLEDLRSLRAEEILRLTDLGWSLVDAWTWNGQLMMLHGDDAYSKQYASTRNPVNKVRSMVKDTGISIVRFHSHNTGIEMHSMNNEIKYAIQLGTFHDPSKANYIKHKELTNWTNSAGLFYLSERKKHFLFVPILFSDKCAVVNGKVYS